MRPVNRWLFFGLLAVVVALYIGLAIPSLDKPGLYMDAVDPDYLVARMIHPQAPTEFWMLPGNLIAGRFPVLAGPYSGSFVAYLLVPFYLVLGGTLTAIRVAHLCLGLAILIAAFVFLRATTRSLAITFAVTAVMAVDPAFVLLFRTQAYICIFPSVLAILGFLTMFRNRSALGYVGAGVLFGLAAYSYFIFFFIMPGLIAFAATDTPRPARRKLLGALLLGVAAGASPYVLGYALVIGTLGLQGAIDYVRSVVFLLKVNSSQTYFERLASVVTWTWAVLTGAWNSITFWGVAAEHRGQDIKAALLVVLPLAAVRFSFTPRPQTRMFRLVGFSSVSYLIAATIFGQRLGGHDLSPLLPFLYILTGLALAILFAASVPQSFARGRVAVAVLAALLLFAGNVKLTHAMTTQLGVQSGVGLFSSILSDYPKLAEANGDRTPHIFWQWGSLFQFIYLTDGEIPAYSSGGLKAAMCSFGSAKIVLTGKEVVHHPDLDFAKVGAVVRATQLLHDRYSGFAYEIITVRPAARFCAAKATPAAPVVPTAPAASAATAAPGASAPTAATTLVLPDGIASDETSPPTGVYPSLPGQCCFLAAQAAFSVPLPAGTQSLRFAVYAPNFAQIAPQRLTFLIDGAVVRRSPVLVKGALTPIDVALPPNSRGRSAAAVTIVPSTAFVPKDFNISVDTRTLSVVLLRVETEGPAVSPGGSQLPDGVLHDATHHYDGIDPAPAGQCCFLAQTATFSVRVPPAARSLRFVVFVPASVSAVQQQLTFSIGATLVRRSGILPSNTLTAIEVPIPTAARKRSTVTVTVAARSSFTPAQLGLADDGRRRSVILMRVNAASGSADANAPSRRLREAPG